MFYYIYKITCTNHNHPFFNHFYIGKRSTKNIPEYDEYKGSGKLIKQYYKEYPYDYTKEILSKYETIEELNKAEKDIINNFINDPLCLNLFRGGLGGDTYNDMPEYKQLERRKRISIKVKGISHPKSEITKQKLSIANKGRIIDDVWRNKISISKKGKPLSEEHKLHIKQNHPHKGHKFSEYEKFKCSLRVKELMQNTDLRKKISESVKQAMQSTEIREKCRQGGLHTKGLIWINNGVINKRITKEQLNDYLKLNYVLGRNKYTRKKNTNEKFRNT